MPVVRVVAATAMPTLPNTWRTTLYKPAAAVILAFSIVPSAAVESATKIRLNPTPCHSCRTNTCQNPTTSVRCDSSWNEKALTRSPAAISRRGPRRLYNSPPIGITTAMARLRGMSARPAVSAGLPSRFCRNSGNRNRLPYSPMPRTPQRGGGAEGGAFQYPQIHGGPVGGELAPDEQGKAEARSGAERHDERRVEPIFALPFLEHQLQRAEAECQQRDPGHIHAAALAHQIRWVRDESLHQQQAEHPDGDVDVEDPRPRVSVGEPAAQGGTEGGREHDAHAVHAHRHPLLMPRERFSQDRLCDRHQHAASRPLHYAEQ